MKDKLPEKPDALANSLKGAFGRAPGTGEKPGEGNAKPKDAKSGEAKDPVAQVWKSKYEEAMKRATEAKDPALKAHAEAEAKQIKLTLDAMEGKAPGGAESGGAPGQAPGAPGAADPGAAGASGEGGPTSKKIDEFMPLIEAAAEKAGVPADILGGMLWQESRGKIDAGSVNGGNGLNDTGLMQVNPNKFAELQAKYPDLQGKNLSDPETNIQAAAYFLAELKDKFGTWELALRGYNSGENGVDVNNPDATPAGTGDQTYIPKVLHFAQSISNGEPLPA
ncbi:lytic transglycosylase domain-containing protein [Noviherbaspirillum sp. ST9]|uniref:lytic transglycosylase domain-containing protein n=1 Tax=Noviherbaspirillum sp. ST9 TaxID=3401606 RepID=UPI003B589075